MQKLYKSKDGRVVAYHEAWIDDGHVVEHWGLLGTRGNSESYSPDEWLSDGEAIQQALEEAREAGYEPIDIEDHRVLVLEYRVEGMGSPADLTKRHQLQDRMAETLGWMGLGHCDGGSIGSGTMEVCCLVVDFDIARRVIHEDLKGTRFGDYSRIYDEAAESV